MFTFTVNNGQLVQVVTLVEGVAFYAGWIYVSAPRPSRETTEGLRRVAEAYEGDLDALFRLLTEEFGPSQEWSCVPELSSPSES